MPESRRPPETALYETVKGFLTAQGFAVKGEIRGCDIVAVRADEDPLLVIVELKTGLSLELVLQAVERMRAADTVWIAVPATRRGRDRDRRAHRLCRLLGIGLMAVGSRGTIEILAEPLPYQPRRDTRARTRILREHTARRGDPTPGGVTRQKIMTAYRQSALDCAEALSTAPRPLKELRALVPNAGAIMRDNFYGWFVREARGVYGLTETGTAALLAVEPAP